MGKVLVIGSSNTDLVTRTEKMPKSGETIIGKEFRVMQGGKGANQAVAAARAGSNVVFVAKLGNDAFAESAISGYQKDRLNTRYILYEKNEPTGTAIILVDDHSGQNSIVVNPGANHRLSVSDIEGIENDLFTPGVLLVQLEIPPEVVHYALKTAAQHGMKTVLNPAPAQNLSDELLSYVDIITPNETEAEMLTGIECKTDKTVEKAATALLKKVNQGVIITLGEKGAFFMLKNGQKGTIPALNVKAVDTTAAGDVFNGYLAAGLSNEVQIEDAIRTATRAASFSVKKEGAQPSIPYLYEIENFK
ncbi:MAG: ribokinase [Prolixibacteraceae bacterium]|nr:ribokinase [Prolixibacteraceae bacterium]